MADDTAGAVTMTIAGPMVPLMIGPHVINNLFIHSWTLFTSFFLFSFPFLPCFPSFSPRPALVLAILLSFPPLPLPLPFHLPSSLSSPSMPPHPRSGQPQPANKSLQRIPLVPPPQSLLSPSNMLPHFHMFKHSRLILASLPSSSSPSSSSFSPALLSSEF